jgi:UDP-2-acetamido-2-deoxy-ribo-hexuluronate aminotransferase
MALMAAGLGRGDLVFTTPFTFIATAEVIALAGATPVFVDIDPRSFNIDVERLRQAVAAAAEEDRSRAKAVIAVDLFGLPADYAPIMSLAEEYDLTVIEDAAQAFGGSYRGRRAGGLAHVGTTSFFPAKPLGCYGDGGALFTEDDEMAETLRSLRVHGKGRDKYDNQRIGINGRLDTIQAAILLAKLPIFESELAARQRVADGYTGGLGDLVETPLVSAECTSAWAQYSVLSDRRDEMRKRLADAGVPTAIYYPKPLHLQPAFSSLGYRVGAFPVSESVAARILSLPMHP